MRPFLLSLLALTVVSCTPSTSERSGAPGRGAAPDFDLENIAGGTTKAAELRGNVSVIDVWATWCKPCIDEIPKFNRLHDAYRGKDVRIVGITVQSPHDDIAPKSKEFGINYTVLVGNDAVEDGFGGIFGWPTTFVVTKDWKIYSKYIGALADKEERIKKDIETLLQTAS